MAACWFYGWNVVAAVFVMAMLSFGLGFYGVTVNVATLQRLHGWSAAAVSAPITVYYDGGALVTMLIGSVYARLGPRIVVAGGGLATAGCGGPRPRLRDLAALSRLPDDVAGLGRAERCGRQHHPGAVNEAAPRPGRQPSVQRRDAGRRGDRPGVAVAHRSVGFARARGWSPFLASNRGLGPLHLIAGAQDGNPPVTGRFGPPIVSRVAGE